jgi:hypothetical protein
LAAQQHDGADVLECDGEAKLCDKVAATSESFERQCSNQEDADRGGDCGDADAMLPNASKGPGALVSPTVTAACQNTNAEATKVMSVLGRRSPWTMSAAPTQTKPTHAP